MTKKKRIIQPVTFTEKEEDLLQYAKSQGKPYSVYIKDLIREKMGKPIKQELTKDDVINIVEEYIKTHGITAVANTAVESTKQEEKEEKKGLGSKGKAAYKNWTRR